MCLTFFLYVILVAALLAVIFLIGSSRLRGRVKKSTVQFHESARELDNPNRGFYFIYDFTITDEETNYQQIISDRYREDPNTSLTMIQICLQNFRGGAITEAGIKNIEALFDALTAIDKQLIVRFMYDNEGKNLQYEPQELEIILGHMRQLETILREHSSQIFTLQGLFVGNWGEMHDTRYESRGNLYVLARQLADVTDASTYLAVRTPVQRRMILKSQEASGEVSDLDRRMGLFNDGMLGNETDYGTYGTESTGQAGTYSKWSRRDELHYQDELCSRVPNGGEVIIPNEYNDIGHAIDDMRTMHVTYLNRGYDSRVFDKWTGSAVEEQGVFDGMDGCTYIERHLGYRIYIDNVELIYRFWENRLLVNISLKNAGFAPMYRKPEASLVLRGKEGESVVRQEIHCDLCTLSGGRDPAASIKIRADIDLNKIQADKYELYFELLDPSTEKQIQLANEQEAVEYGYLIGEMDYKQKNSE